MKVPDTRQSIPDFVLQLRQKLPQWAHTDWLEQTGSTNADLFELARQYRTPEHWPRLLGSNHQTQGKGRAGRPWLDRSGETLMFSCGFMLNMPTRLLAGVAPALGIATCEALRPLAGHDIGRLSMKWPNDIMIDDSKLAGILVESRIMGNGIFLVVGMGLNLAGASDLSAELNRDVSDWSSLDGAVAERSRLVAQVAQSWQQCLALHSLAPLQHLRESFELFDYLRNRQVNVLQGDQIQLTGTASGLAEDGSLLVRLADGTMESVRVGDISVRKV
ncbi:biotin--[acetyl-CoA-carboxylase] ligase [Orrella marina]|uniref:biotin--[biotin carboxyl-carrier protein] ligase n=1 Tax=Orrella marina TaxID=2163011 RepID=A0A2R4XLC3_9BURK|nr:biotin--[acetyl-CoA-carboxylase] ligase [Orrella marina]AWB34593.1 biotin--[acetyl-CoA-carboxylase] ligase [Orrella marina]